MSVQFSTKPFFAISATEVLIAFLYAVIGAIGLVELQPTSVSVRRLAQNVAAVTIFDLMICLFKLVHGLSRLYLSQPANL